MSSPPPSATLRTLAQSIAYVGAFHERDTSYGNHNSDKRKQEFEIFSVQTTIIDLRRGDHIPSADNQNISLPYSVTIPEKTNRDIGGAPLPPRDTGRM